MSSWILSWVLVLMVFTSSAQDYKRQYRQAKDLFASGEYSDAMIAFKALTVYDKDNTFSEYASFYYAMSAYRLGYLSVSKDRLLQIKSLYPKWDQMDEVNYLLSKIYFEQKEYFQGRSMMDQIKSPDFLNDLENLKRVYLSEIDDVETLRMMLEDHPGDTEVAKILVKRLGSQEYHLQDTVLINSLVTQYGLNRNELVSQKAVRPIKRELIRVGVIMPFLASTLDPSPVRKRNQIILEMYQGMKLAADSLSNSGKPISLLAYDNERNLEATKRIVRERELKGLDLIVGPFFQEESRPVSEFSASNRIAMVVNPLSNSSESVANNPYHFLFQPSYETMGRSAADFAANRTKRKNCFVYYGDTAKDSVMAANFIARAQELNFRVLYAQRVTPENSASILSRLTTATEFDEWKNPLQFSLKKDSLGCIFVASSNELIYSKVINSVESRKDSILLIGQESWLDDNSVDYTKFERINIVLTAPNYKSVNNPAFHNFRKRYVTRHGVLPSDYASAGYEFIMVMGEMMSRYGVNFLQTTHGELVPGFLGSGLSLSPLHDNQIVPLVALKNGQLVKVN